MSDISKRLYLDSDEYKAIQARMCVRRDHADLVEVYQPPVIAAVIYAAMEAGIIRFGSDPAWRELEEIEARNEHQASDPEFLAAAQAFNEQLRKEERERRPNFDDHFFVGDKS